MSKNPQKQTKKTWKIFHFSWIICHCKNIQYCTKVFGPPKSGCFVKVTMTPMTFIFQSLYDANKIPDRNWNGILNNITANICMGSLLKKRLCSALKKKYWLLLAVISLGIYCAWRSQYGKTKYLVMLPLASVTAWIFLRNGLQFQLSCGATSDDRLCQMDPCHSVYFVK